MKRPVKITFSEKRINLILILCALCVFFAFLFTCCRCRKENLNESVSSGHSSGNEIPQWSQFMANPRHTGFIPVSPINEPKVATIETKGDIMGSASMIDNHFALCSLDTFVYFFSTGEAPVLRWKYKAGHKIFSTPAFDRDGKLFVGCQDKNIYCLSMEGSLIWKYETGGPVPSSPSLWNGAIYACSQDGFLYCLSHDGKSTWKVYLNGQDSEIISSPAISGDGIIYTGTDDGNVYSVTQAGKICWKFKTGGPVVSSPTILGDNSVVIGSGDGNVYRISEGGELIWKTKTGDPVEATTALFPEKNIYMGSSGGNLYCLDYDGNVIWKFRTGGPVNGSGAVDGEGNVYVGSDEGNFYSFSPEGKVRWKIKAGGPIFSSPAIGEGVLVFGSGDGNIYVISDSNPYFMLF